MVYRFHGNGDVGYLPVDGIFRTGERFVRIDGHAVPFVRQKVAVPVMGDKATEPFAEVKNPKLCPQVRQPVSGRGSRQPDNPLDRGSDTQKTPEAFCLIGLEGRKLVNDNHIEVKGKAAFLNQPGYIFPVDQVNMGFLPQRCLPLGNAADDGGVGKAFEMVPFLQFCRPGIPCYTERSNNQDLGDFKAVKAQVEKCRQRDDAFSKPHVQEYSGFGMPDNEIGGIGLIVMRTVFHRVSLRSVKCHPGHRF